MHWLLTTGQMRRADALTIAAGTPGYTLMLLAGEAVAETAAQMLGTRGRVLVLCGPGNNGGDGFVAARRLREMGHDVVLALLGNQERLKDDAARAAGDWTGEVHTVSGVRPADLALVIDALFGAGLARDLDGEAARAVERMNVSGRPILAVDMPSGIDGDTGAVRGTAVRATRTVTFARRKPGHLLLPGRAHCGSVAVADIGIADATIAATGGSIFANAPALWAEAFPRPTLDTHKYRRGHALVLSGAALHTGAARLAARGALRVGAGLVTLASPAEALAVNAAHSTAVMLRRCEVAAVLAADRAAVLDADALTSFEGDAAALAGCAERCAQAPVLTPHEGEFARLFKAEAGVLDGASKLERARRAAALMHAIVVLKGADTVIAAPDERAAINENATPDLATAGSGDVLTGVVAGLLAQGMAPFEAACAGVWVHAEAGRRFGAGLIAEDIPEGIPAVISTLRGDVPAIPRG